MQQKNYELLLKYFSAFVVFIYGFGCDFVYY